MELHGAPGCAATHQSVERSTGVRLLPRWGSLPGSAQTAAGEKTGESSDGRGAGSRTDGQPSSTIERFTRRVERGPVTGKSIDLVWLKLGALAASIASRVAEAGRCFAASRY